MMHLKLMFKDWIKPRLNYGTHFKVELDKSNGPLQRDALFHMVKLTTFEESINYYRENWKYTMMRLNPDLNDNECIEIFAKQFAYENNLLV